MEEINNKIIIYNAEDGQTKIDVRLEHDTVWLTQDQMAELFDKSKSTINEHVQNIYKENELVSEQTMRKFGISEFSGKTTKPTNFYQKVRNVFATSADEVITRDQAEIAKNYLEELELKRLNLLVEQFLSFAELQSVEKRVMYMNDWIRKLDDFLVLNDKDILGDAGSVSRREMEHKVRGELERFNAGKMLK